jgi:plasmid maintenance system antidote protein VapI
MAYTFEILGVSPILTFFNHQQKTLHYPAKTGVEYLACYRCSLDAVIESIEAVAPDRGWQLDTAVDAVMEFWLHNADRISYWKQRLSDAGRQNLLVSRLADFPSLQAEVESLLDR